VDRNVYLTNDKWLINTHSQTKTTNSFIVTSIVPCGDISYLLYFLVATVNHTVEVVLCTLPMAFPISFEMHCPGLDALGYLGL